MFRYSNLTRECWLGDFCKEGIFEEGVNGTKSMETGGIQFWIVRVIFIWSEMTFSREIYESWDEALIVEYWNSMSIVTLMGPYFLSREEVKDDIFIKQAREGNDIMKKFL